MWQYPVATTSRRKTIEKMTKDVDLLIESQRMWNKTLEVIPIIIRATGVKEKNLKKYLNRIPGCHYVYNPQRYTILGGAHIPRSYYPSSQIRQYRELLTILILGVGFMPDEVW